MTNAEAACSPASLTEIYVHRVLRLDAVESYAASVFQQLPAKQPAGVVAPGSLAQRQLVTTFSHRRLGRDVQTDDLRSAVRRKVTSVTTETPLLPGSSRKR